MSRALLITSNSRNIVPLKHLLESLKTAPQIPLIVVVGNCDHDDYAVDCAGPTEHWVRAPHNSIDFTALVAVLELWDDEKIPNYHSYFCIHDTTRAGPEFVQRILSLPGDWETASFAFPSMNIGLYHSDVLHRHREVILSFKNVDESEAPACKTRCVEQEDKVFHLQGSCHRCIGYMTQQSPPTDYYGTGTPRVVEYYPCVDLYKIKSNWHPKSVYCLKA